MSRGQMMNDNKFIKICISLIVILGLILVVGIILMMRPDQSTSPEEVKVEEEKTEELTETLWYYPKNIVLGEALTDKTFLTADGASFSLDSLKGKITVVTYWASWCKYCKEQLQLFKNVETKMEDMGIQFLFVDKLDNEKETMEQAEAYLEEHGLHIPTVYDKDLSIYEELGLCIVPTTFVLNERGNMVYCYAGVIESEEQLNAIIEYAKEGPAKATEEFVKQNLMSSQGGIFTNYEEKQGTTPSGHDILSESQGLIMEYAADTENETLFRTAFSYVKDYLYRNNLAIWVYSNGEAANSNALLDDLRILKALSTNNEKNRDYETEIKKLAEAIAFYNIDGQKLVDFYDFSTETKASRFTLCYGDLVALKAVADVVPHLEGLDERTLELIQGGYISNQFPFYYNYYDYKEKSYNKSSLNMAEAMYTLYHLSEVGQIRQESIDWIKKQMGGNGIWARYDVNGEVVTGYEYQSSAIYALVGLIAININDNDLLTKAVSRMEESRCFQEGNQLNGAFAKELSEVMSYDQCLALLLYGKMEEN